MNRAMRAGVAMNITSIFSSDIAIDLGTANTCVFAQGRGIVLNEPSIVAFNVSKGQVEAVGTEAQRIMSQLHKQAEALERVAA